VPYHYLKMIAPNRHPPRPDPPIDLLTPWPDPRRPGDEPLTHLQWAEAVARSIAASEQYGFGYRSQEADELVGVARVAIVELAARFDALRVRPGSCPDQLFRGWAHRYIPKECAREAERLRNAGAYWTTSKRELKELARRTAPLSPHERCPSCRAVMGLADDDEPDEDVNGWLKAHGYG
jgi:hypothetical protein